MSTVTKSENTGSSTDNKALFGPLGKYAIVGVMMGSIIVTTAIMLDRQPGSKEHIAAIQKEIAMMNASNTNTSTDAVIAAALPLDINSSNAGAQTAAAVPPATTASDTLTAKAVEAAASKEQSAVQIKDTVVAADDTTPFGNSQAHDEVTAVSQPAMTAARSESVALETDQAHLARQAIMKNTVQNPQPQLAVDTNGQDWQAQIDARELEYREHLTDFYERVKSREFEQLENYKKHQDSHIEFLREQISRQEQIIEKLMLRNQENYDMREASMQRRQLRREELLNRI